MRVSWSHIALRVAKTPWNLSQSEWDMIGWMC